VSVKEEPKQKKIKKEKKFRSHLFREKMAVEEKNSVKRGLIG